jgi:AcrR family transcriptional regulator
MARPRSERARSDVLDAAHDLLLDRGLEGFTVEAVSARSGVAKTTIYRHWPSAHELLLAALRELIDTFPTPNTGSVREDLLAYYRHSVPLLATDGMRSVLLGMLSAAAGDPDIGALHEELLEQRQHPLTIILELAIGRRELPPDLDVALAEDLLDGFVMRRVLIKGATFAPGELEQLLDWALAGLHAGSLSGRSSG